jgi:hypothetical protein
MKFPAYLTLLAASAIYLGGAHLNGWSLIHFARPSFWNRSNPATQHK